MFDIIVFASFGLISAKMLVSEAVIQKDWKHMAITCSLLLIVLAGLLRYSS